MPFKRPTLPELINRVDQDLLSRISGSQAALAMRVIRALSTSTGGVVNGLYGYLQWLEKQLFPETCDDENLHLHSAGVPRRLAAHAVGYVRFQGTDDRPIVAGTVLQDGEQYETTEEVVIAAGVAIAPVRALEAGSAGDRAEGDQLQLVEPVSGVVSQATVEPGGISGGANLETYESWRDRIMLRRSRIPRGGARGDWAEWALEVSGVTRAWEDPLGMGPGSVVIRVMADDASDGPLPSSQLLVAVKAYIEERKNVQAHIYVVAPDTQSFEPELLVMPNTEETRGAASQALQDLVEREGEPGGTLKISRIRSAISLAPGVEDYDLQWPTANVVHGTGVLPIWGGVTWLGD